MANQDLASLLSNDNHNLLKNAFFNAIFDLNEQNHFCNIFEEDSLIDNFSNSNSFLALGMNVQSLNSKFTHLTNFIDNLSLQNTKVSFFSLQEIWKIDPDRFNIDGYNFYCKTRAAVSSRGGVGLYIDSSYKSELLSIKNDFIENIFESLTCKVTIGNSKLLVASIYRPNTHTILKQSEQNEKFLTYFNEYLHCKSKILDPNTSPTIFC